MLVRLLIVDDHAGFRSVARAALEADGFEVLGEAGTGETAVSAAERLHPDIVLLDVHLPAVDGFAVCRRLVDLPASPRVVLISSRPIADLRRRVSESPAVGFLPKHELSGDALRALVS
jgi:DNA-binding NarL/FixJ family response regulator